MSQNAFFERSATPTAAEIASWVEGSIGEGADRARVIHGVAPLESAGRTDLAFIDNTAYLDAFRATGAGVCLAAGKHADKAPSTTTVIIVDRPYHAYATVLARLYPTAVRPQFLFDAAGGKTGIIHPTAMLEDGVIVDPGAIIGAGAQIGAGTTVGPNSVIAAGVTLGRNCALGANVSVSHAHLGDRVVVHHGATLGQDGFGFAMGADGHRKVPQVGRAIIQNDVEIGANTTIDRGANRDTIIGEGTKIDNLVQIAHNVVIGRHCVIVSQTGVSGSATLGDFVVLGGKVGVVGHVSVGDGAQIAATSSVNSDVPPGARWGGAPAKPVRQWFREVTAVKRLAERGVDSKD